jgi:phosphoglycerate kinase
MPKLTLQKLPVRGKRALVRVDFNVPLTPEGQVADDTRIRSVLPTIDHLLKEGASIVLMSHLGRPKGEWRPELSLAPVATRLAELLGRPVKIAPDCIGEEVEHLAFGLQPGEILLLENLRFHPAETKPEEDPSFAQQLAKLGEVYINDAFGTAHRRHASTALVPTYFPGRAAAGFLMQKEIQFLGRTLTNPDHPFYAIIGGAKVSSKLGVLKTLVEKVDGLFVGGGMAFTFLKAQGIPIGKSLCEEELLETTKEIIEACKRRNIRLYLPIDIRIAKEFQNDTTTWLVESRSGIPSNCMGMDIGPKTVELWSAALRAAATILWNGPLGVFEFPNFAKGTEAIAHVVAKSPALSIVGGGDSIAAIQAAGVAQEISHISTGGGATLELIEFGHLPGIDALSDE